MPPVLALGALGALGFGLFKMIQSIQADKQREQQFRAANGWSLAEVAAEVTSGFSHGGDGGYVYDAVNGVKSLTEATRVDTRTYTASPGLWGMILPAGTKLVREERTTWSIEPMLRRADTNHDGVATMAEIAEALRAYDADGNGRLSAAERARASSELQAVKVAHDDRAVGVVSPPPAPARPKPVQPQPKSPTERHRAKRPGDVSPH
jgi:hypothetical protein